LHVRLRVLPPLHAPGIDGLLFSYLFIYCSFIMCSCSLFPFPVNARTSAPSSIGGMVCLYLYPWLIVNIVNSKVITVNTRLTTMAVTNIFILLFQINIYANYNNL